uniref:Uncharacterized protein n=1 Tax=Globisporangium ultimum (strain ATCC 200006 / CBS 805.95 / DAOM BR144) TaxID=431595 RepID=K3X6F9_GLOUD
MAAWAARGALADAHAKPISSLKFSKSGDQLASASADRSVKVWATAELLANDSSNDPQRDSAGDASAASKKPQIALYGHEEGVNDASWSHDGYYLASASDDKTARIWDVEYGKTLSILGRTSSSTSTFNMHGIAMDATELAPPGTSAAAAAALGLLGENESHTGYVFSAQFNPQGSLIVTASFDETVRFWDVRTGRSVAVLSAHHEPIVSANFNHDGTLLITASYDGLVRIWDVATRECLRTIITEPTVPLSHAQFTPNSRYVVFGTLDSKLRLWDYAKERCVKQFAGHVNQRYCCVAAFGRPRDGYAGNTHPLLLYGSEDGRVCMWDMQTEALVEELKIASGTAAAATHQPIMAVDHHPDKHIVAAAANKTISMWEQTK